MVNKNLFKTGSVATVVKHNAVNRAGGLAYERSAEEALATYCCVGTFNGSFYANAGERLEDVKNIVDHCSTRFIAQAAYYGVTVGRMKDIPSYLAACLTMRGEEGIALLAAIAPKVLTGKRLFNFVQIVRSGVIGRKSFGRAVQRILRDVLNSKTDEELFQLSFGHSAPSLVDIIKMVRPKPHTKSREALHGYLLGKEYNKRNLPKCAKILENFKAGDYSVVPNIPFMALTNYTMTKEVWTKIAMDATWNTLRMNLNNFGRHEVFTGDSLKALTKKLNDKESVRKTGVFPYQIMSAYLATEGVPVEIKEALQDCLEYSTENIPTFDGQVAVCIDTSGSMSSSITGRSPVPSKVRCIDVAALMGVCVLRKNKNAKIVGFAGGATNLNLNPRDTVITNCLKINTPGGSTNCSSAIELLHNEQFKADLVIIISDNESWADYCSSPNRYYRAAGLGLSHAWANYKLRNKKAKLVLIDIQAGDTTTQIQTDRDILNISSFNDSVFKVIETFYEGKTSFVEEIERIEL